MTSGCLFCTNRELIIYENAHFFGQFDKYPVSTGHALVISKRHVVSFFELQVIMTITINKKELENEIRLDFNPTLESILMVERAIKKYSGEYTVFQLWKKLPRKITYQAYKIIIAYLINSNKITMDSKKVLVWIWNPDMIERLEKQGLIMYD